MSVKKIVTFNDKFLRKISKPVKKVDDRTRQLLQDMADTMYNSPNGGGLAACQVGILQRLIVADMGGGLLKLVNPLIIEAEGEQLDVEGCLSYPGIWGKVVRPARVMVQALDEHGKKIFLNAKGAMAKCLCHEIDHLDGIIFTDKVIEFIELE